MILRPYSIVTPFVLALLSLAHAGMYGEHVVVLNPSNFDKIVMESAETFMVKFYAPWCGHCQSSAPAFSKAAKKLDGVAKLGVVDCDEHKELAQRFGISGFPTIKVFKGVGKKARRPSDYNQARSTKAFVEHMKYIMPSFVARVKPSGADAFFKDESKLPHVLLFTDKSSTSPLYKGMSSRFKGRISFGEVRKPDAGGLAESYTVNAYPTLLSFKVGESGADSAVPFQGAMDPTSLNSFFESIASDTNVSDGGPDQAEKVFAQPKAYSGDVATVYGTKNYEETCGSRKDGRMCGLAIIPGGESHSLFADLKPIAEQYQYDNMAFAVLDSMVEGGSDYAALFDINAEVGGFLIMRARKKKYAILESDETPTKGGITAFLDKVVGGDARFKKLTADLPVWEVEEAEDSEDSSTEDIGDSGSCGMTPPKDGESCGEQKEEL